jgi:hypothetical protein
VGRRALENTLTSVARGKRKDNTVSSESEGFSPDDKGIEFAKPRLLSDLIVHDPSYKPFVIAPFEHCVKASEAFDSSRGNAREVDMLLCGDRKIERHAFECIYALMEKSYGGLGRILDPQLMCHYWIDGVQSL